MTVIVLIGIVYVIGIVCVMIMKKLQPDDWIIYAVWVAVVCVALTCFVVWYVSSVQAH